ncbi:MAG TPA: precorrin-6A synthase (deacetylating) [Polyangiales bacterium]|nr:precorrin-6A synthase (deacetylating) [Polyangiales bacterium]
MRRLLVIGMGPGHPDQLTVQAVEALRRIEVLFVMDKGAAKADLVQIRKRICERHLGERSLRIVEIADPLRDPAVESYESRVAEWHERRAELWADALGRELGENGCGGFLVWGDPALYDSTLRILDQVQGRGITFDYAVIPGVSSLSALAASHRIVLNRVGGSVHITTGRRLAAAIAAGNDDVVVMLDGEGAWKALDPDAFEIYWSAYLGTPHELNLRGVVREVGSELERTRSAARARHGWIFDTYLLRRIAKPGA